MWSKCCPLQLSGVVSHSQSRWLAKYHACSEYLEHRDVRRSLIVLNSDRCVSWSSILTSCRIVTCRTGTTFERKWLFNLDIISRITLISTMRFGSYKIWSGGGVVAMTCESQNMKNMWTLNPCELLVPGKLNLVLWGCENSSSKQFWIAVFDKKYYWLVKHLDALCMSCLQPCEVRISGN